VIVITFSITSLFRKIKITKDKRYFYNLKDILTKPLQKIFQKNVSIFASILAQKNHLFFQSSNKENNQFSNLSRNNQGT
jgi:hypothetical protein